jgi:hypothetical protein
MFPGKNRKPVMKQRTEERRINIHANYDLDHAERKEDDHYYILNFNSMISRLLL